VTLFAEGPELWDVVVQESTAPTRYVGKLARHARPQIPDVGCATGSLCSPAALTGHRLIAVATLRRSRSP
jgi:hypothetical protein